MGNKLYISDLHFSHKNIIKYDNRPYFTVSEMNKDLIEKWNNKVKDDDIVYILGDISWDTVENTIYIFQQLKGNKVLIKGNHDTNKLCRALREEHLIESSYDYLEINDNGKFIIMSHYFIPFWNGQFRSSIHLYGHVHNTHQWNIAESWLKEARALQDIPMNAFNVGCMMPWMEYEPKTLGEISMGYKRWSAVRNFENKLAEDELDNVEIALNELNIKTRNDNGQFRNTDEILKEVVSKWNPKHEIIS